MFKKRLGDAALIVAIAAAACELAAIRLHGRLEIAAASRSRDTASLAVSTDRLRLLGLALSAAACVAAVAGLWQAGGAGRANLYALVLVMVAFALGLVS